MRSQEDTFVSLPNIADVRGRGESDEPLFRELRALLERHQATRRFGITLLHKHFDLAPDELLLEEYDPNARTLTARATKFVDVPGRTIQTHWRFDRDDAMAGDVWQVCPVDADTNVHTPGSSSTKTYDRTLS